MEILIKQESVAQTQCPAGVCASGRYPTKGEIQHACTRFFTPSWPDSRNVSFTITHLHWKIGVKIPDFHPCLLKCFDVEIKLMNTTNFPWVEKPTSHVKGCSFGVLPHSFLDFIIQATWGVGLFQSHAFFPNEILYCGFLGYSVLTSTLTLKCHTCSGTEPLLCREQEGPEWAELHSHWKVQANWLPWQWHDTHWACDTTDCERRGERWAPYGNLSTSHLEVRTMWNLSSCSGGILILM